MIINPYAVLSTDTSNQALKAEPIEELVTLLDQKLFSEQKGMVVFAVRNRLISAVLPLLALKRSVAIVSPDTKTDILLSNLDGTNCTKVVIDKGLSEFQILALRKAEIPMLCLKALLASTPKTDDSIKSQLDGFMVINNPGIHLLSDKGRWGDSYWINNAPRSMEIGVNELCNFHKLEPSQTIYSLAKPGTLQAIYLSLFAFKAGCHLRFLGANPKSVDSMVEVLKNKRPVSMISCEISTLVELVAGLKQEVIDTQLTLHFTGPCEQDTLSVIERAFPAAQLIQGLPVDETGRLI